MPGAARMADVTHHAGVIIAPCAMSVRINDRPAAHIGSIIYCPAGDPVHGVTVIVFGNFSVRVEDKPIAHQFSPTSCGALVVTCSGDVVV